MRPGSTPRRCPFRPSCRAAFGGPRPLSRPGVWRRCGPPGRAPFVGLENKPAPHVLHTNYFFQNHRGQRVRIYAVSGVEPRPPVRCGLNRWRGGLNLARRCGPRLLFVVWEFGARALRIASPSLAPYANGGNASRFGRGGGYRAPPAPQNLIKILGGWQSIIKRVSVCVRRLLSPPG